MWEPEERLGRKSRHADAVCIIIVFSVDSMLNPFVEAARKHPQVSVSLPQSHSEFELCNSSAQWLTHYSDFSVGTPTLHSCFAWKKIYYDDSRIDGKVAINFVRALRNFYCYWRYKSFTICKSWFDLWQMDEKLSDHWSSAKDMTLTLHGSGLAYNSLIWALRRLSQKWRMDVWEVEIRIRILDAYIRLQFVW